MENPNPPRNQLLGYDAMKAVLKSMSVEKRQDVHAHIPQLRTANSLIPFKIDNVETGNNYIRINEKRWTFKKVETPQNEGADALEAKEAVDVKLSLLIQEDEDEDEDDIPKEEIICRFQLEKSPEEAYDQLFDNYLKNGTVINKFVLNGGWRTIEKKNSDNWKIGVSSLEDQRGGYMCIYPFLDLAQLNSLELCFGAMNLLNRPEIINCKKLQMRFESGRWTRGICPIGNLIKNLKNQHLLISQRRYSHKPLIEAWIETGRPVGTRFTYFFPPTDFSIAFHEIETSFDTVTVEHPEKKETPRCMSLKMADGNDLIIYFESDPPRLEMEVFKGVKQTEEGDEGEPSEKISRNE